MLSCDYKYTVKQGLRNSKQDEECVQPRLPSFSRLKTSTTTTEKYPVAKSKIPQKETAHQNGACS